MDLATALWIVVPLAAVHVIGRRWRGFVPFQIILDVVLVLLPGRVLLSGSHLGPGVPGAETWGAPRHLMGSPEQTDLPLESQVWFAEVRRLVGRGLPPWVSDRIGGGVPLFANGQSTAPFPVQLPVWLLGPERGTDVTTVWRLEAGALGTFLLLRRLALMPAAAAVGALAYGLNLYLLSWVVVPIGGVVAAAPWAWWGMLGALRGRRRAAAFLALLLGALAGWQVHPETAAFVWIGVGVAGLTLAWGRWRRIRRLAVPLAVAMAVAAVGALPTLSYVTGSAKLAAVGAGPQYPIPEASWELRGRLAALVLAPWREGHPADGSWHLPFASVAVAVSVGAVALLLAAASPLRRRHRRVALAASGSGILAAAMLWQIPGITQILARIPPIAWMTWARTAFHVSLAIAVLAALALDAWLRRPRRGRLVAVAVLVQVAVVGLVVTAPRAARPHLWPAAPLPAVAALAAWVPPPLAGWTLAALVAGEQTAALWRLLPGSTTSWSSPTAATAALQRLYQQDPQVRVLGLGDALPPNLAARFGLADLRSHDPMRPLRLARLHQALGANGLELAGPVSTPWAGLAGAWGVAWLATGGEGLGGAASEGWEETTAGDGWRIYRNRRALPVVRLARATSTPPGDPAAGLWEANDFETTAILDQPVALEGAGELTLLEAGPGRWRARVTATGSVLALLHVPCAPGWRTTVDGNPTPIVIANLAAMGVMVGPGVHEVVWDYQPTGLWLGAAVTCAGLVGCLLLGLPRRRVWR